MEEANTGRVGPRMVTRVYAIGAVACAVLALADALRLRSQLPPVNMLMSEDVYQRIWWDRIQAQALVLVLPIGVALVNHFLPQAVGAERLACRRAASVAPWVWLAGAVAVWVLPWWFAGWSGDGGWFNYAPNAGVTFSPDGSRGLQLLGQLAAYLGLALTGVSLVATVTGHRRADSGDSHLRAWTVAATAAVALAVVVLAVRVGQIAIELVTEPGVWGR